MSAPAATWNIVCDQGKTLSRTIRYGTKDPAGTFTPFDNTGYGARMMWRKSFGSAVALSISSAGGEISLGGANGEISFTIDAADMEALIGNYVYDLELFIGTPEVVIAPVRGTVRVRPEVTT